MMKNPNYTLIPDRSQPGITMTAPTVRHRDVIDKYATGVPVKENKKGEHLSWNIECENAEASWET